MKNKTYVYKYIHIFLYRKNSDIHKKKYINKKKYFNKLNNNNFIYKI